MKLVLTSADIFKQDIFSEVVSLVGKPTEKTSVAVLTEASAVENSDKRWLINGLNKLTKTFGGTIDIVNLLALPLEEVKTRIEKCDVIYCFGGSTEWLKKVFDKSGFSKLLPELLKTKVWVGSSAGSMILGKMPTTATQDYLYNVIDYYGVKKYLEFVNFSILPHLFGDFVPKNSFSKCVEESKKQKYPVYVLSDKSAVIVNNSKTYLVGKKCYKLVLGKIEEKL